MGLFPEQQPHVRWRPEEIGYLAKQVAHLRLDDVDSSLLQLLKKAQLKLFPERQRRLCGRHALPKNFANLVKDAIRTLHLPEDQPPPVVVDAKTVVDVVKQLQAMTARLDNVEKAILHHKPHRTAKAPLPAVEYHKPNGVSTKAVPESRRRLRICLIGVRPEQVQYLMNRVGKDADIRFLNHNLHSPTFPSGSDEYVLCVKNLNRGWSTAAKAALGDHAHIHNKGFTELVHLVKRISRGGTAS